MNPRYLAALVVGMAIGGGLAYVTLKEKHEQELQLLLDENNEMYLQLINKAAQESEDTAKDLFEEYIKNDVEATEALTEVVIGDLTKTEIENIGKKTFEYAKPDTRKTKYSKAVKPNLSDIIEQKRAEEEHPEDDEPEVEPTEPAEAMPVVGRIYIIKDTDWSEEFSQYDKETLTYYPETKDIVDGRGEILDIEDTLGSYDNLVFGQDSGSPYVVYIRNERLDTDFEVVLDDE